MIIEDVAVLESMIKQLIDLKTMAISSKHPLDINDVLRDSLSVFEQDFQQKTIRVETDLQNNLPRMTADKKLLKRAFCNIIKNSVEAMETGTKLLKVASRLNEKNVEIEIADTGGGISKEKINNIFDPMVTSKVYGPGLGLTFALRIVQEHQGSIVADSEPGKGTKFLITLPVQDLT
jgi:signal transduction histidine kinase